MGLKDKLQTIFDSYSRRRPLNGHRYKPDQISNETRNRILMLYFNDVLNVRWMEAQFHGPDFRRQIHQSLRYLLGRHNISGQNGVSEAQDLSLFLGKCSSEEFFNFIELTFKQDSSRQVMSSINEVVDAINEIFRFGNEPYQLTHLAELRLDNQGNPVEQSIRGTVHIEIMAYPKVIRVDEEITHVEAIKPALSVLEAPHFKAANGEFRQAMEDYRKSNYDDCLRNCANAFESVMKVLCKRNRWPYKETDTAAPLLKSIIANSSLDGFFEQPFMLIATMRNRLSTAHGAGNNVRNVDRHIAQYAITATAGAIVLLAHECDK